MYVKRKLAEAFALIAVFCVLFSTTVHSQERASGAHEAGGMGYSMFGRAMLDLDALNSRLEERGYSSMSDNFFSTGGGMHWIYKSGLILGGEIQTLLGGETVSGYYKHSLTAGYGIFDIGYTVFRKNELRIYPLLGVGGGAINFKISEAIVPSSFNDVLDNPRRSSQLWTGGFLLNVALGMDYLLTIGEDERGKGGFVFGVRAGYILSPSKGGWTLGETELADAPEMQMTGPYIRLMFGGGGLTN